MHVKHLAQSQAHTKYSVNIVYDGDDNDDDGGGDDDGEEEQEEF